MYIIIKSSSNSTLKWILKVLIAFRRIFLSYVVFRCFIHIFGVNLSNFYSNPRWASKPSTLLSCAGRERQFQLGNKCKCKRNRIPTTRTWQLLTLQLLCLGQEPGARGQEPEGRTNSLLSSVVPPSPRIWQIVSCQRFWLPSRLENWND